MTTQYQQDRYHTLHLLRLESSNDIITIIGIDRILIFIAYVCLMNGKRSIIIAHAILHLIKLCQLDKN